MADKSQQLTVILEDQDLLPDTKQDILTQFQGFFTTAQEWKEKAEALVVTDASQTQAMKDAREARLALKALRVEADKTRKRLKEDGLRKNKAIQGVYNIIEHLVKPLEIHLADQENFVAIQAAKRKAEITEARRMDAQPYAEFLPVNLAWGDMSDEEFKRLLEGAKLQLEQKEAEKLRRKQEAEAARIKAEEERRQLEEDNKRLRAEAAAREKAEAAARKKREAEEAKLAAERKAAEEKAAAERAKAEKAAAEERARREAELEKARQEAAEAKAKLEAEEQAKRDAEAAAAAAQAAEEERLKAEAQKAAQAPDKEKLRAFAETIKLAQLNAPKMESTNGKAAMFDALTQLDEVVVGIKKAYFAL